MRLVAGKCQSGWHRHKSEVMRLSQAAKTQSGIMILDVNRPWSGFTPTKKAALLRAAFMYSCEAAKLFEADRFFDALQDGFCAGIKLGDVVAFQLGCA